MSFWESIFAFSCLAVLYNYAGYAAIVYIINRLKGKRPGSSEGFHPTVSFIVAAYNEEDCLEKKIANSLAQDYPADRIEYIFITDGSTDGTMDIIRRYPAIQLLHGPERRGKSAALNRAVGAARHDILIFSDANTYLNPEATRNIARHYSQAGVGGVAGEKKVIAATGSADEVGATEGLYWKYESFLKQLDSDFYSVVGAAGELFSLRRTLYEPVPDKVILDDFVISMKVAAGGHRIVYEPAAYAMELPSFSIEDEQKRKIRIAAGGFQAMIMLRSVLLFWRQPRLSFLYISHRVLRWTLSPVCLLLAFLSALILSLGSGSGLFRLLFLAQLVLYGLALAASFIPRQQKTPKLMKLAYYFVFMNVSVVLGFFRFLRGRQPSAWEKAKRNKTETAARGA